jgi:hypothetical protein
MPMPMPGMPSTPYLLAGAVVALVLVGLVLVRAAVWWVRGRVTTRGGGRPE